MQIKNLKVSERKKIEAIYNSDTPLKTLYDIEIKSLNIPKENADACYMVIDKIREEKEKDDFSDLYKFLCAAHTFMSIVAIAQKLNGELDTFEASSIFCLNALIAGFSGIKFINKSDKLHTQYMEEPKRKIDQENYQKCKRAYQKSKKRYTQIDEYMKNKEYLV